MYFVRLYAFCLYASFVFLSNLTCICISPNGYHYHKDIVHELSNELGYLVSTEYTVLLFSVPYEHMKI